MVYLFEFANDAFNVLHCDAASVYCGGLLRVCAADAFTSFLLISDDDLSFIFFSFLSYLTLLLSSLVMPIFC